jgi:hypothetical protein
VHSDPLSGCLAACLATVLYIEEAAGRMSNASLAVNMDTAKVDMIAVLKTSDLLQATIAGLSAHTGHLAICRNAEILRLADVAVYRGYAERL